MQIDFDGLMTLRKQCPQIRLAQITMLMKIAEDPGITTTDLRAAVNLEDGPFARMLATLGPADFGDFKAMHLIAYSDPIGDARVRTVTLSEQGKALVTEAFKA